MIMIIKLSCCRMKIVPVTSHVGLEGLSYTTVFDVLISMTSSEVHL
jgi:hypothetical protein